MWKQNLILIVKAADSLCLKIERMILSGGSHYEGDGSGDDDDDDDCDEIIIYYYYLLLLLSL